MPLDKLDADYLCEEIAERYDPDEIVDILGFSSEELVEALRSYIIDNAERFEA
jgi:hypothetical protein